MVTLSSVVISEHIRRFVLEVQQRFKVLEVYLFGSQVTGSADQWSDIDILVVSPDFSNDRHEARLALMQIARSVDKLIEQHPMAPEDFNISTPLAYEVKNRGVRISLHIGEKPENSPRAG